jgi:hypothetical protein
VRLIGVAIFRHIEPIDEWLCDTADSIPDDIEPNFQDNGEQQSAFSFEISPEFANYTPLLINRAPNAKNA